jgi:endoglucanase
MKKSSLTLRRAALAALFAVCSTAQAYYVSGGRIYNEAGTPVTLQGVNWFGFETDLHAVHGLP